MDCHTRMSLSTNIVLAMSKQTGGHIDSSVRKPTDKELQFWISLVRLQNWDSLNFQNAATNQDTLVKNIKYKGDPSIR